MSVKIGVLREITPGENRVALDPSTATRLLKMGVEILLQKGAGETAFFRDEDYQGVTLLEQEDKIYQAVDIVLKVQGPSQAELELLRENTLLIGFLDPYRQPERIRNLRDKRITSLAMELVPRISRAQAIDALSSQANLAGYKCAIIAANMAPGFFPMLTTAAGTIRPAKVVVIGAGVAGLQAIATAKRLGAQVEAYDIRPAAKEQVESLGAKLIDTGVSAAGEGGYARELTNDEKQQQTTVLTEHLAKANAIISTAAIPGRPAPRIISKVMVDHMRPGTVLVDMAAETGGNCELTRAGETIYHQGVAIYGPINLPSSTPLHASELYARNLFHLLNLTLDAGELKLDWNDEVLAGTCLTRDGEITHPTLKSMIEGV